MKQSENSVHLQVVTWLKIQYPTLMFRTDMGGIRLNIGQSMRMKTLQKGSGWPDLFIAHPIHGKCGLFIEIKATIKDLYKADGRTFKNEHSEQQAKILKHLTGLGYYADFACGFDGCVALITNYLNGE